MFRTRSITIRRCGYYGPTIRDSSSETTTTAAAAAMRTPARMTVPYWLAIIQQQPTLACRKRLTVSKRCWSLWQSRWRLCRYHSTRATIKFSSMSESSSSSSSSSSLLSSELPSLASTQDQELLDLILQRGDLPKADDLLGQLYRRRDKMVDPSLSMMYSQQLRPIAIQLFDAHMDRHALLLRQYTGADTSTQPSFLVGTQEANDKLAAIAAAAAATTGGSNDMVTPPTRSQGQILSDLCHALQDAYRWLVRIEPLPDPNYLLLQQPSSSLSYTDPKNWPKSSNATTSTPTSTAETLAANGRELPNLGLGPQLADPASASSTTPNSSAAAAAAAGTPKRSKPPGSAASADEGTARCNQVLRAWANTMRSTQQHQQQQQQDATGATTTTTSSNATPPQRAVRGIPQRAQLLLEQMEASYQQQQELQNYYPKTMGGPPVGEGGRYDHRYHHHQHHYYWVRPTVDSYNCVLEAWAYSGEHMRGPMAERVFQRMGQQEPSGSLIPPPNGESYQLIILAWTGSSDRRRAAFTATGHLMKMLRKLDRGEIEMGPSLEDYHRILKAWLRADDKTSPHKAMSVLRLMEQYADQNGTTMSYMPQPDRLCYQYILQNASRRPLLYELGPVVDDILGKMKERMMVPDTICYSAAIRTWRNAALNGEGLTQEQREKNVRRTKDLLAEMRAAHHQSTQVSVRVGTENMNDVIEALTVSTHPHKSELAERLLEEMESTLSEPDSCTKPNAASYRYVINAWQTSTSPNRLARAQRVLLRLKENYDSIFGVYDDLGASVDAFNAFIALCKSMGAGLSEGECTSVLREAFATAEVMNTINGLEPEASTYALLLEACDALTPQGPEKQILLEKVFCLARDSGKVDDNVLTQLRQAATPEVYWRLVVSASVAEEEGDDNGNRLVPESWTVKALGGGRVITAQGRRAAPLRIDGTLAVTRDMLEFRMRRLRDKRNRNLLRGGRLRQ